MKRKKAPEAVQIDISETFQQTQEGFKRMTLADLLKFYKANSVDEILMNGILEQRTGEERIEVLRNLQRILKPGGKLMATVAYWGTNGAVMSPFSKWPPVAPESLGFFCEEVRKRSNYNNPVLKDIDFDLQWAEIYPPEWQAKNDAARSFAARHYTNVLQGLSICMTKKEK